MMIDFDRLNKTKIYYHYFASCC